MIAFGLVPHANIEAQIDIQIRRLISHIIHPLLRYSQMNSSTQNEQDMLRKIGCILSLFLPTIAFAMEQPQRPAQSGKPQGLSVGLGAVGSTGIYVGEKTEIIPVPVISYESDRFFIRGLSAGAALYGNRIFSVNAIANVNMMNLDVGDLNTQKLSNQGISKAQLEDRDRSVDLGVEANMRKPYGTLSVQALQDVGGASEGAELRFNYQYFWRIDPQLSLIPSVGVEWLSEKRANYYYGILDSEVARGVEAYRPDDVFTPNVSLAASYALNEKVNLFGVATHKFLPNKVQDSPLVDQNSQTNFFMAVNYKF